MLVLALEAQQAGRGRGRLVRGRGRGREAVGGVEEHHFAREVAPPLELEAAEEQVRAEVTVGEAFVVVHGADGIGLAPRGAGRGAGL
jgi:hypothetical protein